MEIFLASQVILITENELGVGDNLIIWFDMMISNETKVEEEIHA